MAWLDDFAARTKERVDERVRDALAMRGVTDVQIEKYGIGYIDTVLPPDLAYPEAFLKETWHGRKLDDSYVFPLTNTLGDVRGFQFRHVDRARTGYTDFFLDRSEAVLFGLGQAMPHVWTTGSIFLVEGNFDLFPVERHVPGVVATLTARVPDIFVHVLRRMVEGDVWMGYDMDAAGRRGIMNFTKSHGDDFKVREVVYPTPVVTDGKRAKDPNELWALWGDEKFGAFLRSTMES